MSSILKGLNESNSVYGHSDPDREYGAPATSYSKRGPYSHTDDDDDGNPFAEYERQQRMFAVGRAEKAAREKAQRDSDHDRLATGTNEEQLDELSNEKLGQYKTAAAADAGKADLAGDYKKADKRFSGIVKATKKQFANDAKTVKEDINAVYKEAKSLLTQLDESTQQQVINALKKNVDAEKDKQKSKYPRLDNPKILGTNNKAKSIYYPPSKPNVKKLDKPLPESLGDQLKSKSLDALQQVKQNIEQKRMADLEQWEKDFKQNTVSKFTARQPSFMQQPKQVARPLEKHSVLKARLAQLDKAIEKQAVLDKMLQRLDAKGLLTPAIQSDTDTSMLVRDGANDNYVSLNQKLDKALEFVKNRLMTNKTAFAKPKAIDENEELDENLHKWFKEKWVRFGPDGKIRGDCARGDDSEGKPKCLPQSKAHSLGKKGRASAASRKRREDPNPERSGKAINVNTKKNSNESVVLGRDEGNFVSDTPVNLGGVVVKNLGIGDIVSYFGQKAKIIAMSKTGNTSRITIPSGMGGVTKDVLTKDLKRTSLSEEELDEACWKGYHKEGNKKMFGNPYPNCVKNTNEELDMTEGWKEEAQDLEDWSKEVNMRLYRAHESQRPALARQLSKLEQKHFGSEFTHPNLTNVVWSALRALQKGEMVHYDPQRVGQMPFGNIVGDDAKIIAQYNITRDELAGYRMLHDKGMVDNLEQFLKLRRLVRAKSWPLEYYEELEKLSTEEAWLKMANDLNWSKDDMNESVQAKTDDNLRAYYAQRKAEKEKQHSESCPHCGGEMVSEELMNEKKDACYYKVKSRYKVWPSAYASGALVKCRKKGASNWGNGGKSNESVAEDDAGDVEQRMIAKIEKEKQRLAKLKQTDPEAYKREIEKRKTSSRVPPVSTFEDQGVAEGPGFDKWADDRAASQLHKLKPGMVQDRKTGKWYDPNKEFDKKMNSPEVMAQMKRMAQKESIEEDQLDEKWTKKYKDSINCSNPKGFSQKAHCAGKQKNESAILKGLKL
jgi:hypothetical protein